MFTLLFLFALFSVLRESESSVTCNATKTLAFSIQGDVSTSSWRLESEEQTEILFSGTGEELVADCLPCGIYFLRVQDSTSTVHVRDSRDNFVTSCTNSSNSDVCRIEVGRTVRFYIHDGNQGGDLHNDSSASSRGKDFLDKTSTTPAPSLPYATSNDDLLNGDDIPIARPVGFEVSSENNSTSFNGKAAFI